MNFKSVLCPELFGGEAYYHDDLGRPYRFCRYGERCTYAHPGDFVRISSRKAYEEKVIPAMMRTELLEDGLELPEDSYRPGFASLAI